MEDVDVCVPDEVVEVMVLTRGENPKLDNTTIQEAANNAGETSQQTHSSFHTLIRTALALEEDPTDEHSYAYSDKTQAFWGKEKDHSYSSYSKLAHRKVQSLSDENLYRTSESSDFLDDFTLILPHYQSKDSALDTTGFDTISEKCLSFDNINVKTVDVVTDKCILPGLSDPDISKMSIGNEFKKSEGSFSLPNSPPCKEQRLTIEHNYFRTFARNKGSTLHDHTYNNTKHNSLPRNSSLKRGRSTDEMNNFEEYSRLKIKDFTKSPFLDQTYQSLNLKSVGKRQNVGQKFSANTNTSQKIGPFNVLNRPTAYDAPSKQLEHDHAYEQIFDAGVDDMWLRNRSCSMSETLFPSRTDKRFDHSYTIQNRTQGVKNDNSCEAAHNRSLSDSGTESLDGEDETMMTNKSRGTQLDHTYVTKYQQCPQEPLI